MCWLTICCLPERATTSALSLADLPASPTLAIQSVCEALGAGSSRQVLEGVSHSSVNQEVLGGQTCQ